MNSDSALHKKIEDLQAENSYLKLVVRDRQHATYESQAFYFLLLLFCGILLKGIQVVQIYYRCV
jgi:hypothetical protein